MIAFVQLPRWPDSYVHVLGAHARLFEAPPGFRPRCGLGITRSLKPAILGPSWAPLQAVVPLAPRSACDTVRGFLQAVVRDIPLSVGREEPPASGCASAEALMFRERLIQSSCEAIKRCISEAGSGLENR